MSWRLILRNILRNRKNSIIIFLLITLITALFFIGNSIMGQANAGLRSTYIDSLTADVIIQKRTEMSMNLFGGNTPSIDDYVTIPALPAYNRILEIIAKEGGIENYTSQVSGRAALQMPEISNRNRGVLICGPDPATYFDCFPGIIIEEGRLLAGGESGAMITVERADMVEIETGIRPAIGSPMLFSSAGTVSFRIREVPLVGIYRYESPGPFMNEIVLADPQTVRVLLAVQVATAAVTSEESLAFQEITGVDDSDFFALDPFTEDIIEYTEEGFDPLALIDFLESSDYISDEEFAGGDWNFILLRLEQGINPGLFIRSLNKQLAPYNVYAAGWRTAAGTSAIMLFLLQNFFNIGGGLVSIAGIIVVVNILLISVFRRIREIGTLRAIGASDMQIRFLVMGENCTIAFLAGIAGVLVGIFSLQTLNAMNLTIPNELIASLLGGSKLYIGFLPFTAAISFCIALFLGAAASLYPVETAVRIDPISAVRQG